MNHLMKQVEQHDATKPSDLPAFSNYFTCDSKTNDTQPTYMMLKTLDGLLTPIRNAFASKGFQINFVDSNHDGRRKLQLDIKSRAKYLKHVRTQKRFSDRSMKHKHRTPKIKLRSSALHTRRPRLSGRRRSKTHTVK